MCVYILRKETSIVRKKRVNILNIESEEAVGVSDFLTLEINACRSWESAQGDK